MGKRWIWAVTVIAALATAAAAFAKPGETRLTDLSVYLGAVDGLTGGASLYDFTRGAAPFTYPPFAALLFTPLTWLPIGVVQVAWTLATLATVAGLAALFTRHQATPTNRHRGKTAAVGVPATRQGDTTTGRTARGAGQGSTTTDLAARNTRQGDVLGRLAELVTRHRAVPALVALALVLSAPVSSDIKYGQVSLFLAALVAADFLALRRTPWHGALVGLAAAIKLTPLIFIPLLWFAGRRVAAAVAGATFAGCAVITAATLPGDSWTYWTDKIFQVNRLGYIDGVGNQSLNGALLRLGLADDTRGTLVLVVGGAIAVAALVRAVRPARRGDWLSAVVVIGAASIVLSPVSWTHHQIWLVLAVFLPVARVTIWRATVLIVMILPVPVLFSESRLLLAITIAALLPISRRPAIAVTAGRGSARPPLRPAGAGR
ncbi:glycosyltransferase 87 family protein [Actinoplanes sp. TRM 88003]|uniref:Glycosyltransferase 87 family protein n=1 Tax=Paractinoplanes aksuensis TaxID=2939490 RepID=A0ABT1DK92_9ACTN|nr:glycosyltransferase 87 family protein [Actinoplanes aksuensis]MCO8271263.1 glycosyltransferase 87 family protein [Actinoplanes aksuensis]